MPAVSHHQLAASAACLAFLVGAVLYRHGETDTSNKIRVLLKRPAHRMAPAKWHIEGGAAAGNASSVGGPLSLEQVEAYFNDGFLILPKFFESRLGGLQSDVEGLIENLANDLYDAKLVNRTYADASWTERLLRLTDDFQDAPIVLTKAGILPKNFQKLYADETMLDIAAQLGIGPDVAVNAAWNLRAKMKNHEETTVPWHQDNSYWEPRIWSDHVMTVWVSLVDAKIENGCMQYVRGAHYSGKTARHTIGTSTSTWYTELSKETMVEDLFSPETFDNLEDRIVTAQVPAGTAIIFPGTTPHRSLNSQSDKIRWSTDYRLHRARSSRPGKTPLDWFYGLKDSLLLRDGKSGDYRADWTSWAKQERTKIQDEGLGTQETSTFDPIVIGPWMDLWPITTHQKGHRNKHVERYMASDGSRKNMSEAYEHW